MQHHRSLINREKDLSFLGTLLRETKDTNNVIVVSASTGVGKSALCKEFLRQWSSVRVPVSANLKIAEADRGSFVYRIAVAIDQVSERWQGLESYDSYRIHAPTPASRREANEAALESTLRNTPARIAQPVYDIIKRRRPSENLAQAMGFQNDSQYWRLLDYIKFSTDSLPLSINVENIQVLDPLSRDILVEAMGHQNGTFFLLEYTTGNSDARYSLEDISEYVSKTGSRLHHLQLSWLPLSDLLNAKEINLHNLLKTAYYRVDGNLRALKDLEILIAQDELRKHTATGGRLSSAEIAQPTQALLSRLSSRDSLVLSAVATHKGRVKRWLLQILYDILPPDFEIHVDLDAAVTSLKDLEILQESNGELSFVHDSTNQAIVADERYERFRLICLRSWANYYQNLYDSADYKQHTKPRVIELLFHLYLELDPSRIWDLLPEVERAALSSKYPREIVSYLEKLADSIQDQNHHGRAIRVWREMARIYYRTGLYKDAWEVIQRVQALQADTDPTTLLYRISLLDRLDHHEQALLEIEQAFLQYSETDPQTVRICLCLKLIKMVSLRSVNDYAGCKTVYDELVGSEDQYLEFREWGFFLRNSQVVLGTTASIQSLEAAIKFFERRGDLVNAAHCRVTLSLHLCWTGALKEALTAADLASSILTESFMERHILRNNRTAIELYAGSISLEDALYEFRTCLRTIANSFDKIVVLNNLYLTAGLARKFSLADEYFESIRRLLPSQPDKHLKRTAYYNRAYVESLRGNGELAHSSLITAREATSERNSFWDYRLRDAPFPEEHEEAFLLQHDYQLGFISHWHFEIPHF